MRYPAGAVPRQRRLPQPVRLVLVPLSAGLPGRVPGGFGRNCVCGGGGGCRCDDCRASAGGARDHQLLTRCFPPAGCSSGLSAETKGVYVLFFLLSSLILMLLVAAGVLYRRHRRGAFLVRCRSSSSISSPDPKKKQHSQDGSFCPDSELPPPPPPSRGFREGWPHVKERCPPVDLPLLRFSPLLPPDGCKEPQEGGKGALTDR